MRIFRLVVVIAVVLSLLVAASVPAYASKDKPPGKKEKPVQVKPKKPKPPKPKDQDQSQPDPDDEPGQDAQEMVTICHKPGTPAEQTLVVAASALGGHLGHGDYPGECLDSGPLPEPGDEPEEDTEGKVTVCHKPGTPAEQTLEIAAAALQAHLDHGDYEGACDGLNAPSVDEPEVDDEGKVLICHKPGTPAEQTLEVAAAAVEAHLAHGDALGSCDDLPDETVTEPGDESEEETVDRVVICHKPGTPDEQTMTVPRSALDAHLDHGDIEGECGTDTKVLICHQPDTPAQQTLAVPQSAVDDHLDHGDSLGACLTETSSATADTPWVARVVAAALSIVMQLQEFASSLTF
jgi:hypothetical protein